MDSPPSAILDPNKSSPSGKVCIVTTLFAWEGEYYAILIVDLASSTSSSSSSSPLVVDGGGFGGYILTAPTLILDRSHVSDKSHAFCVLDSSLYMFELGLPAYPGPRKGSSAYTVDLHSHLIDASDQSESESSSTQVLDKSMVRRLPDMLCPKNHTVAIPTSNAKRILVFSRRICFGPWSHYDDPNPIDFELYNPPKNKWEKLPPIQHFLLANRFTPRSFNIDSFGFITDSVFLIETRLGIFTLDIEEVDGPGWKIVDYSDDYKSIPPFEGRFFVIDDHKLCIAKNNNIYNTNMHGNPYLFDWSKASFGRISRSSFADDFKHAARRLDLNHIIYQEEEGGKIGHKLFGIVCLQTALSKHTMYVHIHLDVCGFDLDKYRDDKQIVGGDARLESSIIKTFKFVLDGYKCNHFFPLCLSPIAPIKKDT